jgi:hypothetical protein
MKTLCALFFFACVALAFSTGTVSSKQDVKIVITADKEIGIQPIDQPAYVPRRIWLYGW